MRANVVVFSKNRAAQADACLRSFLHFCKDERSLLNISVLYKATADEYVKAYELCAENAFFSGVEWKPQRHDGSFQKDLSALLRGKEYIPLTMFLVDDILFREPFSFFDKEIESIVGNTFLLAASLRLDKNITQCYATNSPSEVPQFVKDSVWQWYGAQGDWGYPYSVDGNVYRTEDALRKIQTASFTNPNQFEAAMNMFNGSATDLGTPNKPAYMICYPKSKLVNIPANRVQDEYKNRVGNIMSPEDMNRKFLDGEQISLDTVKDLENTTVHVEIPILWEKKQ